MGETQKHIDNDIVDLKDSNIDNDIVDDDSGYYVWEEVLKEISEYKLDIIRRFMFGEDNKFFGNCTVFVNPAIKQIERFTYIWMTELSENARRLIINYYLGYSGDDRTRAYKDYLNSPVWKYVSSVIKMINGYTCEGCGKQFNPAHLVIHHQSYAHLGSELNHLDDLSVLCTDCHLKIHGIRRENERK